MALHMEEVATALSLSFRRHTRRMYGRGSLRVGPTHCVLPVCYRHAAARVRDFAVRPDDVWVVTYPKCGTTWTQEMTWLIMNNLDMEGAKRNLLERSPFLEYSAVRFPDEDTALGLGYIDSLTQTDTLPSPRCIKTHLPRSLLPTQLWTVKPKVIYVTRGLKDVVVSYYSHHRLCNGYSGSLEDFVDAFMAEDVLLWDPYWRHILDFWELREEPHVLINRYEDMKTDLAGVVRRTAAFLGRTLDESQVAALCQHLHFNNMRRNNAVNYSDHVTVLNNAFNNDTPFMRKGEVGAGREELPPSLAERLDQWGREKVKGTGYPWQG